MEGQSLEEKIKHQIEYYISNDNLKRDVCMRNSIQEWDGLALNFLMDCNRINELTKGDRSILEDALKNIKSDKFELDSTGHVLLPKGWSAHKMEEPQETSQNEHEVLENGNSDQSCFPKNDKEICKKTVFMRGFPVNSSGTEIKNWCTQFGSVKKVYLNFSETDVFNGTVYVTFDEQSAADDAVAFLAMQKGKYNGMLIRVKYPAI